MKASDIRDETIVSIIYEKRTTPWFFNPDEPLTHPTRWVLMTELEKALPAVPRKVILAKMRALMKKGLVSGCGCGCRGDFELTEDGAFLAETYLGLVVV